VNEQIGRILPVSGFTGTALSFRLLAASWPISDFVPVRNVQRLEFAP